MAITASTSGGDDFPSNRSTSSDVALLMATGFPVFCFKSRPLVFLSTDGDRVPPVFSKAFRNGHVIGDFCPFLLPLCSPSGTIDNLWGMAGRLFSSPAAAVQTEDLRLQFIDGF